MILKSILEYLRAQRIACWRMNVIGVPMPDGRFRPNKEMVGVADICCIIQGKSVWLEVKTQKGKQTDKQKVFEQTVKQAQGHYYIVRSIEDAKKAISGITK